jgi:hypothetical protein
MYVFNGRDRCRFDLNSICCGQIIDTFLRFNFMCVFSRLFGSCREVVVVAVVATVFPH